MYPIKRADNDDLCLKTAGVYKPVKHYAHISCPKCAQVIFLHDYKIEENGQVFPSIICPSDGCKFHEHIKLKDWDPNEK